MSARQCIDKIAGAIVPAMYVGTNNFFANPVNYAVNC